jgi:hypothetical protein
LAQAHNFAVGVPPIAKPGPLDTCPICAKAKLHKAARSQNDSRRATQCYQGISVDFGFIVQSSSADSSRLKRLRGLHGETCYCLIVDHFSGMLFGQCFTSKAPPIDFLNHWLALHGLPTSTPDCYVRFDLGGELGRCDDIVQLFNHAGYHVEPTAPDSSHQNGPGERPHRTIADGIRTMLAGASLQPKFWPYAFHHFLRLYNVTPHGTRTFSPVELCSGQKPDLSFLRVFGCRVFALPARPRRPTKLLSDARTGIFLGYAKTFKNIMYYDTETETVKTAQHVVFDETMIDHPSPPPNARLLALTSPSDSVPASLTDAISFHDLDIHLSPFYDTVSLVIGIDLTSDSPFGFDFSTCSILHRAFISAVHRSPIQRLSLRVFASRYLGAYIVSLHEHPIFYPRDIDSVLTQLRALAHPRTDVTIVLAPERKSDVTPSAPPPLHLRRVDILHISRLLTSPMTDEERKLPKLTRARLQRLSNWSDWDASFDKQLDEHYRDGALGPPVLIANLVDSNGSRPPLLRFHWT